MAFESSSDNFEIHGASIESISGQSSGGDFNVRSAGGQLATGIVSNIKKIYSGILYWLLGSYKPDYQQIHYRWRNDDGSELTATWATDEDTQLYGLVKNVIKRLRFEISNEGWTRGSGLALRLDYAETSDCSSGSYVAVSLDGSNHWQIADSSYLTDGDPTTNVSGGLTDENPTFVAGQVKDTGNQTTAITITSENFTEIEFSLKATNNATNGGIYCFRLSNAGSTNNFSYLKYAKVKLNSAPTVNIVNISPSPDITLNAGTTRTVTITATITDNDGCEDVFVNGSITGVFYDAAVENDTCSQDDNDCYPSLTLTEVGNTCEGPGDYTADASVEVPVWFHANPSSQWTAKVTATDAGSLFGFNTQTVTINTLLALDVTGDPINYGTVNPGQNTGSTNQQITIYNVGNVACDIRLYGTDITWSGNIIDASYQQYSLSEFTYGDGTYLKESPEYDDVNVNLPKPTSHSPSNSSDTIYWGLGVPSPMPASPNYTGANTFEVINAL